MPPYVIQTPVIFTSRHISPNVILKLQKHKPFDTLNNNSTNSVSTSNNQPQTDNNNHIMAERANQLSNYYFRLHYVLKLFAFVYFLFISRKPNCTNIPFHLTTISQRRDFAIKTAEKITDGFRK